MKKMKKKMKRKRLNKKGTPPCQTAQQLTNLATVTRELELAESPQHQKKCKRMRASKRLKTNFSTKTWTI